MQQITLIGNIGKDAEVKKLGNNDYTCFNVGVSKKDSKGESITTWYTCYKYGTNDKLIQFLTKGTKVAVSGDLTAKMTESSGKTYLNLNVSVLSLELLGSKQESSTQSTQAPTQPQAFEPTAGPADDLPF